MGEHFYINGIKVDSRTLTRFMVYDTEYQRWHEETVLFYDGENEVELNNDVIAIINKYCSQEAKDHAAELIKKGCEDELVFIIEAAWNDIGSPEDLNKCVMGITRDMIAWMGSEADYIRDEIYDCECDYLDPSVYAW